MAKKKKETIVEETFETIEYSEVMKNSFVDYALSTIIDRAVPDVRDGLKPVQRRILFDMHELKLLPTSQHRKCARIVGDTMGKYHPHGDSSIYDALIRMSQDFKTDNPLVDVHGNNGTIDGDTAAAMRYTEARLSSLGQEMVKDLHPAIVDYVDNFDETEKEPNILPTLLPNLMLIGVNGLAVGFRTEIPTHNLGEIVDGIVAYMGNKKITTKELMKYVKGPDYPTGGIVTNKKDLLELYNTGNGKITIRSKLVVENGTGGKKNLIITEIPYTFSGNKLKLIDNLISLMKTKKLDEISDIRDESGEDIRIVLEVKKGVDIDKLQKKLYAKTKLEDSQSCNFLVIKGTVPMQIGLKDYIKEYVEFQNEIYLNKYKLMLSKAERELEILEGLCMAYDQLDAVIETIRYAKNLTVARKCLMTGDVTDINYKTKKCQTASKKFAFSELQAQTILDMKLQRLNNLEITAIEKNRDKVAKDIVQYNKIIKSKTMLNTIIKKDLIALKEKYATPRKTKITDSQVNYVEEKVKLVEEDVVLLIDRFGYAKTVSTTSFNRMNDDSLAMYKSVIETKTTDKLLMATNVGNIYQLKVVDIPKGNAGDKGVHLEAVCKMDSNETVLLTNTFDNMKNIVFVFNNGYIKNVEVKEYESRQKKTVGTKLYNNELVKILGVNKEKTIELESNKQVHTLNMKDIPLCKKGVKGNKVIKLKKNEEFI